MKTYSLEELTDRYIGKPNTPERIEFKNELRLDLLGDAIRQARKSRNLTQEELGKLIGVQKSQISKLERNSKNVTIETILKVFKALKTKIKFSIEPADSDFSAI